MPQSSIDTLSSTEKKYVKLTVDECLSRKEIAEKLCRSEDTVATQMKNIYRKLNITKVTELSKLFFKGCLAIIIIFHGYNDIQYRVRRYRRNREIEVFIPIYSTEQL